MKRIMKQYIVIGFIFVLFTNGNALNEVNQKKNEVRRIDFGDLFVTQSENTFDSEEDESSDSLFDEKEYTSVDGKDIFEKVNKITSIVMNSFVIIVIIITILFFD